MAEEMTGGVLMVGALEMVPRKMTMQMHMDMIHGVATNLKGKMMGGGGGFL